MVISGHEQVFKPNDSEVTERKMALKAINIQRGGGGRGLADVGLSLATQTINSSVLVCLKLSSS